MLKTTDRRSFLKNTTLGLMGLTFLPSFTGKVKASDKLRIAHIGLGGMGNAHMNAFAKLPEVDIVALCDVDSVRLAATHKKLMGMKPGTKVDTYTDFRRILERKDIDAISCATPDHWHAQIACLSFQAGKDVYGEKPLSYDVKEGQTMLKYMNKYDRVFQMGNQIHAEDNYHRVVELVRSGAIGDVHTVRLWKTGGAPDLGNPQPQAIPSNLDWDMWLGPAPYTEYMKEKCHFTYRYFLEYSGGVFADFWCHIADIVYWSLDPKGLNKITARGQKPKGIATTPENMEVDYEFDNLKIFWTSTPPAEAPDSAKMGIGACFEGSKGKLVCDYGNRSIYINGEKLSDIATVPLSVPRSPGHHQNFVDAVKSRTQPESNLEYARKMTLPMHLGLISYRLGRSLDWNEQKEKFVGDKEANSLLSRKPRKKWDLL